MIVDITKRVHLDIHTHTYKSGGWDFQIASYVERIWPLRGYLIHVVVGVWRWQFYLYLGE